MPIAKGQRVARRVLHQAVPDGVPQLVTNHGYREVGIGLAHFTTLERHDLQAGLAQLLRENPAGPPESDDHDIDFPEFGGHLGLKRDQRCWSALRRIACCGSS